MNEYYTQVEKAMAGGDRRQAIRILGQVIAGQPDNIQAWLMLAEAVEEPERRRECYQRVLRIDPRNSAAQEGLIRLAAQKSHAERLQAEETVQVPAFSSPADQPQEVEDTQPQKRKPVKLDAGRRKKIVRAAILVLAAAALAGLVFLILSGRLALPFLPKTQDSLVGTWQLQDAPENLLIFQQDGWMTIRSGGMEVRYTYSASPMGGLTLTDESGMSYSQRYRLNGDRLEFGNMIYTRQTGEPQPTEAAARPGLPPALTPGIWESTQFDAISGKPGTKLYVFSDQGLFFNGFARPELLNSSTFRICPMVNEAEKVICLTFLVQASSENAIIADISVSPEGEEAKLFAGVQMVRSGVDESSQEPVQDLLGEWKIISPPEFARSMTFRPDGSLTLIGMDDMAREGTFEVSDRRVAISILNPGSYLVHSLGTAVVLEAENGQAAAILLVK